ncbi:MAG: aminoacyl-tRNA deacylase [gamma proteobacterium symbiont of Ctena orbiculata]|uniref:Cys-tRNA(Pro)/Cys-tRNA(Cys) deacylase n=1 Tax=Candidatus Thiodiazotropha taylori TaxID=2792791 RepID=A0A944MDI9_9GAMM|nr:Cys-tRNA(Pro) deacylase [Candidatus Thiodiazotropha taylori]PUB88152.1 MAG: Cys-tRNA(Pro) deacylase [gamma proteobacterium symbiont of Ctena orbiculata]MBT2989442.1 Cys-tRNA(Pro) deacylase [Candidatus Thiodiazotropha taylori]MBT2997022.1 Cys-tRNA(Pro) deacylase [Candidatus Thiodiazotropha taylori]MBT3000877.1 Cys-tRNA(Pro) deacylase [Candidatus Thiodiazotropha taylori]
MTPAINAAKKAGIEFRIHSYEHDSKHPSYGMEAAEKLGIPPQRVFKTLVVSLDGRELAVAVVPVSTQLDLKAFAKAAKVKKAAMADARQVERSTGYVVGGVSPLGQKKRLLTLIDRSAADLPTLFVSAGRRGLEIELLAEDLAGLLDAQFIAIAK